MRISWTGHRPDLFLDSVAARAAVEATARELLQHWSVERFLVGGQRGVDTWAALTAHTLGVPFVMLLPLAVPAFTAEWSADDREVLEHTIGSAVEVHIVGGEPERAYSERNRLLATSADLLVAVWTGRGGGGTAETVGFARQFGTPIREVILDASPTASFLRGRGR